MNPTIKIFPKAKFIGKNLTYTYSNYRIVELWNSFMVRRNEIKNQIGTNYFNIQINPQNFDFNPNTSFVKWAAVEVLDFNSIPDGMEILEIQEGLYAIFHYVGNNQNAANFFNKIYKDWLPNSEFELDNRPQFEILGEKYKNDNQISEEDIYIPIKRKEV